MKNISLINKQGKVFFIALMIIIIPILMINLVNAEFVGNMSKNLVSYYSFEETTGNMLDGAWKNNLIGYNLTIGETGVIGKAISFNKTSYAINSTTSNLPSGNVAKTMNIWVYPKENQFTMFGGFGTATIGQDFQIGMWNGHIAIFGYGSDWDTNVALPLNVWSMITVTSDTTTTKIYRNGTLVATGAYSWNTATNLIELGAEVSSNNYKFNGTIDEFGIWNYTMNATEANSLWNNGNGLAYSTPVAYNINITLVSPLNVSTLSTTSNNFTTNFNITGTNLNYTWRNATYYIYSFNKSIFNSTTVSLLTNNTINTLFIDDFTLGSYSWNVYGCYSNNTYSNCSWSNNGNFTFSVGASISNLNYSSNVYETSNQVIFTNLQLLAGTNLYDAKIVYNGTQTKAILTNLGSNLYQILANFDTPTVNSSVENKSFYFNLIYSISPGVFLYENTTTYTQSVSMINLSKCTSAVNKTANFTLYDEENQTILLAWNFLGTFDYWLGSGTTFKTYSISDLNINSAALCINPNNLIYKSNAIIQYEKTGYVKRNYYLVNNTLNNISQNINLFLLTTAQSTSFIVTVRDANQLPVTDAYIYIQRYYPGTGTYQTIAMSKTDASGNTVSGFEAETEDYRIMVMKDGVIIYTSPVQKIYCSSTPCTLPIQTGGSSIITWTRIGNLSNFIYSLVYDNSTKTWSYTYVDTSGTTHYGRLYVYQINSAKGKITICNVSSTSNAATLVCNVSSYEGNVYAEGYISRSPEIMVWIDSVIIAGLKQIMGMEGLFWGFIVISILAIAGVLMAGIPGGIIGVIISMIAVTWLGIASFGAVTLWGVIILGIFIIWIIKN